MSLLPDTFDPTPAGPPAVPAPVAIPPMPLPALPLPTIVTHDLSCRTCGYNLRSLVAMGVCPECATPIIKSLKGNSIRHSDPRWIRQIRWGVMACLAGTVCAMISSGLLQSSMLTAVAGPTWTLVMSPASLAIILGYAAVLAGAWMMTVPDPAGSEKKLESRRQIVRVMLICRGLHLPIQWMIENGGGGSSMPQFLMVSAIVGDLLGLFLIVSLLRYLRLLADRIPNPGLTRSSTWIAILLSLVGGLEIGLMVYRELFSYIAAPTALPFYTIWGFTRFAFFFVVVYYASLLNRWNSMLKEEESIARALSAARAPAIPRPSSVLPPMPPPSPPSI